MNEPKDNTETKDKKKNVDNKKRRKRRKPRRNRRNDNNVYVGKRPTMNYVMAAMLILNKNVDCTIKARGRAISHAVDVSEILINKFYPTAYYKDIRISTEQLKNDNGKISNVSSMEIVLGSKKVEAKPKESEEPPKESEEPPKESEEPPKESEEPPKKSEEPPKKSEEPPKKSEEPPKKEE